MLLATDLARLFVGTTLLAFASYTDWRWRRAPNVLWLVMLGAALVLLAADAAFAFPRVREQWVYLALAPAFALLMFLFYQFHLIAGGADAKALMALAFLVPFPVALGDATPLVASPFPGAFTVLGNALLAFLVIPLALFAFNVARGDFSPLGFLGYRKATADLARGHAWPMEFVDDEGRHRRSLFPSKHDRDVDEQRERLLAKDVARVWVTPKVPFMIPLTLGFALAFWPGDLLFLAMDLVMGA